VARYRARPRCVDEAELVERLKEIAQKKRRRGYRLAHRELRRSGLVVNHIIDAAGVGARSSPLEARRIVRAATKEPQATAARPLC